MFFLDRIPTFKEEFQAQAAFNHVAGIAKFHRIQISPGFRAAADYVHSALANRGLSVATLSFAAGNATQWWSQRGFSEWACDHAELVLMEDGRRERLCSFEETKTCLVQRSAPTPSGGLETTIIAIERGEEADSYAGLDVSGKIVFSRGDVTRIARLAVDRFGAAGIVVDSMREQPLVRERMDLPDGRQYLGFWPANTDTFRAFGFVLTPRQGEALRKRLAAGRTELKVLAKVVSRFYAGSMEVVTAVIPGHTDQEVVAIAHLCHPEPSANDNASGAGVLIEVARTLWSLITEGRIPRPRRTIRLLWLPEMTGSYAYLAHNEQAIEKIVAAINLDMVGQNQELCGSTLIVEKPPRCLPGFGGDLAEVILRSLTREVTNYDNTAAYARFRWTVTPYSGGSDHAIWGDPSVGVTCPQIIQWPDRFYHTSEDTIDKVDPRMLALVGTVTTAYLYTAASATPQDAAFLAGEMAARFPTELDDALVKAMEQAEPLVRSAQTPSSRAEALAKGRRLIERRAAFLRARKQADINSLLRLAPDSQPSAQARVSALGYVDESSEFCKDRYLQVLATLAGLERLSDLPEAWAPEPGPDDLKPQALVPVRVFRGPFSSLCREQPPEVHRQAEEFARKYQVPGSVLSLVQYWANGHRNLAEIAGYIEAETGYRNLEMLVDYVDLMVERRAFRIRGVEPAR